MSVTAPATGPVGARADEVSTGDLALFAKTADDPELQAYVTAALGFVRRECGPITVGQWCYPVDQSRGDLALRLPPLPEVVLSSVDTVIDPDGIDVTAQLTVSDVDWARGAITAPGWRPGTWRVTATRTRPEDSTEALKLAVLVVAKNLWELQRGKSARPAAYGPQDATPPSPAWNGIPARAKKLMEPYLIAPVLVG